MSTALLTTKAIRNTRKIERPRPLNSKRSSTIGELDPLNDLENLYTNINNCNYNESSFELVHQACASLKKYGAQLEAKNKDQLDRYFVSFRDASRDDKLDTLSKLEILEAIELRARGWKQNDQIAGYYQDKFKEIESLLERGPSPVHSPSCVIQPSSSSHNIPLSSGEVFKNSGKFSKATKIPGKNYFKDEIMIRNSDSGKVMGIKGRRVHMIEELSDTIISFQRVAQGVKERRVQITGPHEDAIRSAKLLIEDTIRRNASPMREKCEKSLTKSTSSASLNSNASEDSGTSISLTQELSYNTAPIIHSYSATNVRDYQYTVMADGDTIRLSGLNNDKLRAAKLVLEEYFANQVDPGGYSNHSLSFTDTRSIRRPLSMNCDFGDMEKFSLNMKRSSKNSGDITDHKNFIPLQRSKSIPLSSTTSSTEDETFKGDCSSAEDVANHADDVNAIYGYTNSPFNKECLSIKRDGDNEIKFVQSASLRRAKFAKTSISNADGENSGNSSPVNDLNINEKIRYTRDVLLYYAKSPFSKRVPKDLIHIVPDFPYLFKKTPDMFDPDAYKNMKLEYTSPHSYRLSSPPKFGHCESVEEENIESLARSEE